MPLNSDHILSLLPGKPGVYQFLDGNGRIIYAGKAINLKKRVASYFSGKQSGKTALMLKRAEDLKHIVVASESDALLLENNIIKTHQPRYNILLKDDKTYPWICIKNEPFPRVFSTRNHIKDGSLYFGPYTSGLMVKTMVNHLREIFKLRTCSHHLTRKNIEDNKFKVCLEYHLGNCRAPCVSLQSEEDYEDNLMQVRDILRGHISVVINNLKERMTALAGQLRFEEALLVKEKMEILSKYKSRSAVVSASVGNVDVFAFEQEGESTYINYLKVIEGAVIQAFNLEMKSRLEDEKDALLGFAITEIRQKLDSDSKEIIVPFFPDIKLENVKYQIPSRGEKMKLLELAQHNAVFYRLEQKKRRGDFLPKDRTARNLEKLKSDLNLSELPVHIECFDNSNISGKNPVAACVIFRNARPSKKEYRHFNIKSVTGPDDFSSMQEIVFRRYKRAIEEGNALPQLVIIDGGKGQLSSAMKSISELGLNGKMSVIGIAKKLEEIYFPDDPVPLYIDKNSISLKIIQQIRNEAHRFGITFHRDKRSADMTRSDLDSINGIGSKTKEKLLKEIGSMELIRKTPVEELERVIGRQKTKILLEHLQKFS